MYGNMIITFFKILVFLSCDMDNNWPSSRYLHLAKLYLSLCFLLWMQVRRSSQVMPIFYSKSLEVFINMFL
jgi:hypothetical protein